VDIITNILNFNLEGLVPDGVFASILLNSSFQDLVTVGNSAEWIHFAEKLGVTGQLSFNDGKL